MKLSNLHRIIFFSVVLVVFQNQRALSQWEYYGSAERCMVKDFAWDGVYHYLATEGRVYYSNDKGASWHLISNNDFFINARAIRCVAGKLYLKADTKHRPDQLFVSTDHGSTWEKITMYTMYGQSYDDYVIHGDTMIMRVYHWMFHSYDGGKTLHLQFDVQDGLPYFNRIYWIGTDLVGVPATGNSYWRSTDLGHSWTEVMETEKYHISEYNGVLWKASQEPNNKQLISTSSDAGLTWTEKGTVEAGLLGTSILLVEGDTVVIANTVTDKFYYSTNKGDIWNFKVSQKGFYYQYHLLGGTLFSQDSPGIVFSNDLADTWIQSAKGIIEDRVSQVLFPGNDIHYVDGISDSYTIDGNTWQIPNLNISSVSTGGGGKMVGTIGRSVYLSVDDGATWTFHQAIPVTFTETYGSTIVYLNDKYYIFFWGGKMTMSSDDGATWSLPVTCPERMQHIGYNDGKYYAHDFNNHVYISDDAIIWQDITYNLVDISPISPSQFYGLLYADSFVIIHNWTPFRLRIDTHEWEPSPYVSNDPFLHFTNYPEIMNLKEIDNILVAACNGYGIYLSYDTGYSWTPFNDGLLNDRAASISTDGEFLYAGMYNGGIWRRPLTDLHHYNIIEGTVFFDKNQNGIQDSLDPPQSNVTVQALVGKTFVQSGSDGHFTLFTNTPGTDTITGLKPFPNAIITSLPVEVNGSMDSLSIGTYYDTAIDASIDIAPLKLARPGFEFQVLIIVKNEGYVPTDMHIVLMPDSLVEFISSDISQMMMNDDSIEWQMDQVKGLLTNYITCTFYLPPDVVPGTPLTFRALVRTTGQDAYPNNNISTLNITAMGAIDPNAKLVYPFDPIDIQSVRDTTMLTYTILFQNKGNYRADNIRLIDTLSSFFDIQTFKMISASDECHWQIRKGNVLEVWFKNINLPAETVDEPDSHGFFKYQISPRVDLELKDEIKNSAQIYFDFNPPVVTNQTKTLVEEFITGTSQIIHDKTSCHLNIYPNPVYDWMYVDIPGNFCNPILLNLYDMNGRLLSSCTGSGDTRTKIDLGKFPAGLLQLVIIDNEKTCGQLLLKVN